MAAGEQMRRNLHQRQVPKVDLLHLLLVAEVHLPQPPPLHRGIDHPPHIGGVCLHPELRALLPEVQTQM